MNVRQEGQEWRWQEEVNPGKDPRIATPDSNDSAM